MVLGMTILKFIQIRATYHMTGLLPFTVYSFRILAVNQLGVSLPSKETYYIVTLREGN